VDPVEVFLEKWILRIGKALVWTVAFLVCPPVVPPLIAYRYVRDRRAGRKPKPWLAFMTTSGRVAFLLIALIGSEGVALVGFGTTYLGVDEHMPAIAAGPVIFALLFVLAVDATTRTLRAAREFADRKLGESWPF
jgi:hypothetical protein